MQVSLDEVIVNDSGIYATATCEKVSACVCINSWETRVICQNAMHKAWRSSGRGFKTSDDALAAYKSPEMKAIIRAVVSYNTDRLTGTLPAPVITL